MQSDRPLGKIPALHLVLVAAGWVFYAWNPHQGTLALAVTLSGLALLRLARGPWEQTDAKVAHKLREPSSPSKRVAEKILDGEELLCETHQHPISLILWWIGAALWTTLAFTIGTSFNWTLAGVVWTIGMVPVVCRVVVWRHDKVCLTDKRIFVMRGFLKTRLEWMPLSKLTNETLRTPWHSNLLTWLRLVGTQYGTIVVDAAGEEDELRRLPCVPYVIQLNRLIMERLFS